MKGLELKDALAQKGVVFSDLAGKLGLTPQGLMHKFSVKNVKPEFIKQVEEALGFKVEPIPSVPSETQQLIDLLKKKDEQIDRLISLLERREDSDILQRKRHAG